MTNEQSAPMTRADIYDQLQPGDMLTVANRLESRNIQIAAITVRRFMRGDVVSTLYGQEILSEAMSILRARERERIARYSAALQAAKEKLRQLDAGFVPAVGRGNKRLQGAAA